MRNRARFGGAVIFSPEFFIEEETNSVRSILDTNNYFTKELIGPLASIDSLDMHLKEFPFDIFHICSHGGQLMGWSVQQKFIDRFGKQNTVEYDEVLSVSKGKKIDEVQLARKWFPKKLNGFDWNSSELHSQNYPPTTNFDMFQAIHNAEAKDKKIFNRRNIPNSCFIQCIDGFHQGMFRFIAAHSSPILFNNSCWSWFDIAETMLGSGLRGYIGTLWNVDNKNAINFANHFYSHLFERTIIKSVHDSLQRLEHTDDQDIYIYWGLHFTTIRTGSKRLHGKIKICAQLLLSYNQWTKKLQEVSNEEIVENIFQLRNWVLEELERICNSD